MSCGALEQDRGELSLPRPWCPQACARALTTSLISAHLIFHLQLSSCVDKHYSTQVSNLTFSTTLSAPLDTTNSAAIATNNTTSTSAITKRYSLEILHSDSAATSYQQCRTATSRAFSPTRKMTGPVLLQSLRAPALPLYHHRVYLVRLCQSTRDQVQVQLTPTATRLRGHPSWAYHLS